jgi:hypothetical protein
LHPRVNLTSKRLSCIDKIDASSPMNVLIAGYGLEEDEPIVLKVKRKREIIELKGKAKLNYVDGNGYRFTDPEKSALKNAWLKN